MSIIKKMPIDNFTKVPNELITSNLSNGALRVILLLLSKPDDWKVFNKAIMKELAIKSDHTMAKIWSECLDSGFVTRTESEIFGAFDYVITFDGVLHNLTVGTALFNNGKVCQLTNNDIHNKTNLSNKTNLHITAQLESDKLRYSDDINDDDVNKAKSKKSKKEIMLSDKESNHFDYIWQNYELIGIVQNAGRPRENKTDIKKKFKDLIDMKISPIVIENYILDVYDECIDKKYLKGLRTLFGDVETLKELQEEYNANNQ